MAVFIALAVLCFGFSIGFVIGTAYGVHSERADEAERIARRRRYARG